ncbi:MAG: T9SS type A sorting domain-containing protein [Saprospiraceae bacterium]|nr:T9SS type A sorting domain-containing protein [Saprospiraceae bacterium]
MPIKLFLSIYFIFQWITMPVAQPVTEARPYYLSHSLINLNVPAMVHGLALDAEKITEYDYQIGNGANLNWQYNNPNNAQGTPYYIAFPQGNHDVFIVTEAVPLQGHLTWSDTYGYAVDFLEYAIANNNGNPVRYYMYETWHCTNTGINPPGCEWDDGDSILWHPRLLVDWPLWAGIVDHVRTELPDQEVWMIPAGQAWHALVTLIEDGAVPGISSFTQLFTDDIHLTNAGNYFVACVMFACIYRESPLGLTTELLNEWGVAFTNMPTPAQAAIMQQVAWTTALNMADYSGVDYFLSNHSVNFTAKAISDQVKLSAQIDPISSVKELVFSHSSDGVSFSDLKSYSINEESPTTLTHIHDNPVAGENYYRIKTIDLDGSIYFSKITSIRRSRIQFEIFPNPVHSGLNIKSYSVLPFKIKLFSAAGALILEDEGSEFIDMSGLPPGIYSISISSGNLVEKHKIIHIGN